MTYDPVPRLRAQLIEALRGPDPDPLELAVLVGLLARALPGDAALRAVPVPWRDPRPALEEAVEALLEVEEDPDEAWDRLCALDELCAACAWLGCPHSAAGPVAEAARWVRAFPEVWQAHAPAAADQGDRLPRHDPARPLWAAVAASAWADPAAWSAQEPGARAQLRWRLSLPVRLPRWEPEARLAAADGALPPPARSERLAEGEGWQLHLAETLRGGVELLGTAPFTATCDGAPVAVQEEAIGWTCPARPGRWELGLPTGTFLLELE